MNISDAATAKASAAAKLIDVGNLNGAERLLKDALSTNPEHPGANALMALVLYRRDRLTAALHQADIAIGLAPTADAFRFKALALIKLKRRKASIEAAKAAVRAGPQSGSAALVLGAALENAKRPTEAEAAYRRALELAPGSDVFRGNLGCFLLRQSNVAGAERVAAELNPNADADAALLLRGNLALVRGRPEEAREFALWMLSRNATDPAALHLLTQVKASQNLFLGLWWRYSMFIAMKPAWLRFAVMIPFIIVQSRVVKGAGLLLIAYLFASSWQFSRMVAHELRVVKLRRSF